MKNRRMIKHSRLHGFVLIFFFIRIILVRNFSESSWSVDPPYLWPPPMHNTRRYASPFHRLSHWVVCTWLAPSTLVGDSGFFFGQVPPTDGSKTRLTDGGRTTLQRTRGDVRIIKWIITLYVVKVWDSYVNVYLLGVLVWKIWFNSNSYWKF